MVAGAIGSVPSALETVDARSTEYGVPSSITAIFDAPNVSVMYFAAPVPMFAFVPTRDHPSRASRVRDYLVVGLLAVFGSGVVLRPLRKAQHAEQKDTNENNQRDESTSNEESGFSHCSDFLLTRSRAPSERIDGTQTPT